MSPARRKGVRLRDDPEARRRWGRKHKLTRYGLTQKQFEWLLEVQQFACAMGGEPFTETTQIFVDHDHACCPGERQSCGKCVRGLLCLSCNTALGQIERKTGLARAYLAAPPGRLLSVAQANQEAPSGTEGGLSFLVDRRGFEPLTSSVSGRRSPRLSQRSAGMKITYQIPGAVSATDSSSKTHASRLPGRVTGSG
jgi:hypothetical protein